MRFSTSNAILLAALIGAPLQALPLPCPDGHCLKQTLSLRDPSPGIPFIKPPKPIVPVPRPFNQIQPGKPYKRPPVLEPKPGKPAQQKPESPPVPKCKRTGECSVSEPPAAPAPPASGFDDASEAVRARGQQSQQTLDDTHRTSPPRPDAQREPISKSYDIEDDFNPPYTQDEDAIFLEQLIPNFKYNSFDDWRQTLVSNKGAKKNAKEDEKPYLDMLETYDLAEIRTMVIAQSKNKELKAVEGDPPLRWSDMVMEIWRTAATKANINPSELRFMVRDNIRTQNRATEKAIDDSIAKVTANGRGDPKAMQTYRRDSTGDELAAYQLIAGTPHGDRVLRMLGDFHTELRNLNIQAFHVFRPTTINGPRQSKEYAIVIQFGH
ncbi:hypothetical protein P154DRAFT_571887 [Amniculicola lignicola CBS 123094]|uniref:Uncharacterized protein n=1 Tax=Amniculicola lignicola CBS 123094 TaxID=1392246 RepID=A0A6A5WSX8_9PLEO|nr:hypothetical protein P154DRAFT_571887 [Amniculicola lignicola CBS 123094]